MHIHGAGLAGVIVVPDGLKDLVPGEGHALAGAQQAQKLEFLKGQFHQNAALAHLAGGGIDLQVAAGQDLIALPLGAAKHRFDPCLKLHDAEGLDHIVVRARLEAGDTVHLSGAGGEHDDRDVAGVPA